MRDDLRPSFRGVVHHLKSLKLPTFFREYDRLARQCAAEGRDHVEFLTRLVELELFGRERGMIERLTGALLDRLTHHVNIIEMNGDSCRLGQSRAQKAA